MRPYVRFAIVLLNDIVWLFGCYFAAAYLVGASPQTHIGKEFLIFCLTIPAMLFLYAYYGLYRTSLRYASVSFAMSILKATFFGALIVVAGFFSNHLLVGNQRMITFWMLSILTIGGSRFAVRYYQDWNQRRWGGDGRRVLIYGAGDMGILALRQLLLEKTLKYAPIAYLDDNVQKHGRTIQGMQVLGDLRELEQVIDEHRIEELVVAIASLQGETLRKIVKRCREKNIACRILPGFSRMLEIEPRMRHVELADLMRRAPRDLNKDMMRAYLSGKRILVTGATGSIGSEIVRQALKFAPAQIFAFDQSEYGLYALREELGDEHISYHLGDVCDEATVKRLMESYAPEIVFHAAAYKHVPMLEANPIAAIWNNVWGTKNVMACADRSGVKSFVLISTDKAVRPLSIMGMSKRLAEILVQNYNRKSATSFMAVRFGNVLGSSGSVVPKFLEQINKGGPVTVTHPDATRYFMLTDEAVQLVLQAASIGQGGEIFILDMGKPVKIAEMAEELIYLMGRQPHKDIAIEFTGLRPGEKIFEELYHEEIEERTSFQDITIGRETILEWDALEEKLSELLVATREGDVERVFRLTQTMVTRSAMKKVQLEPLTLSAPVNLPPPEITLN
ncbi:MAG: polysaccharide biosynthesis protein [Deltaproteobacteria bacterium]|nr:polysaccharide biosynthesis protein [Deltaproteobacteria bacterium]